MPQSRDSCTLTTEALYHTAVESDDGGQPRQQGTAHLCRHQRVDRQANLPWPVASSTATSRGAELPHQYPPPSAGLERVHSYRFHHPIEASATHRCGLSEVDLELRWSFVGYPVSTSR